MKKDIADNKKEIIERMAKEDRNDLKKEKEAKKNLDMDKSFREAKVSLSHTYIHTYTHTHTFIYTYIHTYI